MAAAAAFCSSFCFFPSSSRAASFPCVLGSETAAFASFYDQTVDAGLGWRHPWGRGGETRINLEVHNLTDETYQDFNRFPGPGRTLFVNLQHRF